MKSTRQVTMSFNNGEYMFSFPVTPESIRITRPQNTKKYVTIDGKEINLSAGAGLSRVNISTFLPLYDVYGLRGFKEPSEIIRLLKMWQDTRKPIRLIISDTDINEAFLIEDMSEIFREGDGDTYVDISLAQYRFVTAPPVSVSSYDSLAERGDTGQTVSKTHVVKKGDTLWSISKMYYGTPYKWHELQVKNNVKDVRKLQIGTVIVL